VQVALIIRAMGFDNTTRIFLASGELFGGKRFMKPFKAMFPRLENHSTVGPGKLEESTRGLAGSAVDYMVCLLSDIFIPTYADYMVFSGARHMLSMVQFIGEGVMARTWSVKELETPREYVSAECKLFSISRYQHMLFCTIFHK
jgi:hypothetical protein